MNAGNDEGMAKVMETLLLLSTDCLLLVAKVAFEFGGQFVA